MPAQNGKHFALDFFAKAPVFTREEFASAHATRESRSTHTVSNILAHHLATGRLVRVRRSLYATVPRGVDPKAATVDPYLVATKLAKDATVAYHAALQFHGKSHSLSNRFAYLTRHRARPFSYRQEEFAPVQLPAVLRNLPDAGGGILMQHHAGALVRVTTLERTLVDVLDAPAHGGGWQDSRW